MEANTTFVGILKIMFPSLIGAMLAVWYKRNDVNWKESSNTDKIIYSIWGLLATFIGGYFGYILGNAVIVYTDVTEHWYEIGIFVLSGLFSLKIVDAIVKNSDDVIKIVTDGVKGLISKIVGKWGG